MNIKTKLIPITFLPADVHHGYANGYIGVPPKHPWYGKNYNELDVDVHGGLTYGADHALDEAPDGLFYFGFDTAHWGDNKENCDKAFCEAEVEKLKQQAETAV